MKGSTLISLTALSSSHAFNYVSGLHYDTFGESYHVAGTGLHRASSSTQTAVFSPGKTTSQTYFLPAPTTSSHGHNSFHSYDIPTVFDGTHLASVSSAYASGDLSQSIGPVYTPVQTQTEPANNNVHYHSTTGLELDGHHHYGWNSRSSSNSIRPRGSHYNTGQYGGGYVGVGGAYYDSGGGVLTGLSQYGNGHALEIQGRFTGTYGLSYAGHGGVGNVDNIGHLI